MLCLNELSHKAKNKKKMYKRETTRMKLKNVLKEHKKCKSFT